MTEIGRVEGDPEQAGATARSLLDAAEEHFASDGFERASLRAVMRAAGADPGAIHYHFGGRPALAAGVLDRLLAPLNANRLERLEAAVARSHPDPVPLIDLVDALIRPDLQLAADLEQRGSGRARLVGAIYLEPAAFVTERVEAHFGPVAERFLPELIRTCPMASPDELAWRIRWVVFGTLGALLADPDGAAGQPVERLAARLGPSLAAAIDPPGHRVPSTPTDQPADRSTDRPREHRP